jgi:hypothetical protein
MQSGELVSEVLQEHREEYLNDFKTRHPDWYKDQVAEHGAETVDESILLQAAEFHRERPESWPTVQAVSEFYMRNNAADRFAAIIREYGWYWMHSPYGFVIGDNPLVTWHIESGRWDYGIEREGVQMTMPLGVNVCLLMTQFHIPYDNELMKCDGRRTRHFNERQRMAASNFVYGNNPKLLVF